MPSEFSDLIEALRVIENCNTVAGVWPTFNAYIANHLALSIAMVSNGSQLRPFSKEMLTFGTLSPDATAQMESNLALAGSRRVVVGAMEPFLVSRTPRKRLANTPAAFFAGMCRYLPKKTVFVVPVQQDDAVAGVAAFAGNAGAFDLLTRSTLIVLAHAAFARARRLGALHAHRSGRGPLSAREIACLSWAAKRKALTEIGGLLKISPRTVRFHLDNARTKLGVDTRAQAVRKAIRQKLIRP